MARRYPQWVTPDRKLLLVSILTEYLAGKGWKVDLITGEIYNPIYEARIKPLIADWKGDDRAQAQADWEAERRQLHRVGERRYPLHGQFSAVSKDIFFAEQPLYYLAGLGISGLTFKPFAEIRVSSSFVGLYIDLGDTFRGLSKSKRRKAIRYGKPLPYEIEKEIGNICRLAVRHYLARQS